jgi:hypothetical protein
VGIVEKIKDLYEPVVRRLKKINDDVYCFVNQYGEIQYYSKKLEGVFDSLDAIKKFS